jgi:hypothetical protein
MQIRQSAGHAADRLVGDEPGVSLVRGTADAPDHGSADDSRADRVDPDAVGGVFEGGGLGQPDQASLDRRVAGFSGDADHCGTGWTPEPKSASSWPPAAPEVSRRKPACCTAAGAGCRARAVRKSPYSPASAPTGTYDSNAGASQSLRRGHRRGRPCAAARRSRTSASLRPRPRRQTLTRAARRAATRVRPSVQRMLDAMTGAAAFGRNGRGHPGHQLPRPPLTLLDVRRPAPPGQRQTSPGSTFSARAHDFPPGARHRRHHCRYHAHRSRRDRHNRDTSDLVGELAICSEQFRAAGSGTTSGCTIPAPSSSTTPSSPRLRGR